MEEDEEEEEARYLHLSLEFAYRNGSFKEKKQKVNDSRSDDCPVNFPSPHPQKKPNSQSNLPIIRSHCQNSRVISPYFQKTKTLECNSNTILSPYFQKAFIEEEKRVISDSVACTGPDSNSQWLISPCSQDALKQQERYSDEHCNLPNEIDKKKKKKKKKMKKDGMDDQKIGTEVPVFHSKSDSSSQGNVSPFFQKSVREEEDVNLEVEVDGKTTAISPYFEKKRSVESDSVSLSTSHSGSLSLLSPYFPQAVKKEERSSSKHRDCPNKIERRKIKKRKREGNDAFVKKREKKVNVQNFRVESQEMNVQKPISCSNTNFQRKVSPYFDEAVKEKEENSEEETKKVHENEESFKEEEESKTKAHNIATGYEKMKLPKKKARPPRIRVVSPYFPINEEAAQKPVRAMYFNKINVAYKRKTPDNNWKPPRSPFRLLQEDHYHDPWRVMVICMLLNCTSGLQASRVISDLFALCPDAKTAIDVPTKMIEKVIETLGLQKKRAAMIQRFSWEYLDESWTYVTELHGIGKYAADAYAIFCSGDWGLVVPNDHMLVKYRKHLYTCYSLQVSQTNTKKERKHR